MSLPNEELVIYLIVKKSLNMSCGKIAAQVGHAIEELILQWCKLEKVQALSEDERDFVERMRVWRSDARAKIALQANNKEFDKIKKDYNCVVVVDAGRTEIASGSETVLAIKPIAKSERCKTIKRMQCL